MSCPVYSPIDSGRGEIRLLQVHPAPELGFQLVCSLQPALLSESPAFDALSYTWGSPGSGSDVQLNGKLFRIQENAAAALRRLRRANEVRTVWVDAICINQADQSEKEGQLPLMREIYEQAEQVCVWLGEPTIGSAVAVNIVQSWYRTEATYSYRKSAANTYMTRLRGPTSLWHNLANSRAFQWAIQLDSEINTGDIRELLSRPWWTRVWTIQEAVVARKLTLMVGPDDFTWEQLGACLQRVRETGMLSGTEAPLEVFGIVSNPGAYSAQDETYQTISRLRHLWGTGTTHISIYQTLYELRHLQCTDARDRVFACLGLATGGGRKTRIRPDYSSSTSQVFIKSALSIIEETTSLDVFHYVREWRGVAVPRRPTFVFSPHDQAKYHDVAAMVTDGPNTRPRRGWARLPDGWERTPPEETSMFASWSAFKTAFRGERCGYYNHATSTMHNESPLEGKEPSLSRHPTKQRELPKGWIKTWDNLGRANVRYAPDVNVTQCSASTQPELLDLPSWTPNWCAPTHLDPEPLIGYPTHAERYWASRRTPAAVHYEASSNTLAVKGLLFDTIGSISIPWHPDPERPALTLRGAPGLEGWEGLALDTSLFTGPCPYAHLEEGRKTALWRTLLGDCGGELALPDDPSQYLMECFYDRSGWGKQPPSVDEMTSMEMGEATSIAADLTCLHWDLHNELRRIAGDDTEIKGSELLYGRFLERIRQCCGHRRLFVTSRGYMGFGPWNAEVGDKVCVLRGGKTPFLLRVRREQQGEYTLVGESYVYGIMEGEAMEGEDGEGNMQAFHIV